MQANSKLDAMIADLATDLRETVTKIEAKPATTRGHYGDYMNLFAMLAHGDRRTGGVICAALIAAGANLQGVRDAYGISFPA